MDLDFDEVSSKEKYVASFNSTSAKRSQRKGSSADSEDSYSQSFEQLKEVATAVKALNKDPVDGNDLYEEVMKMKGYEEAGYAHICISALDIQ